MENYANTKQFSANIKFLLTFRAQCVKIKITKSEYVQIHQIVSLELGEFTKGTEDQPCYPPPSQAIAS